MNVPFDLPDSFWAKVNVRGPDECWEWVGTREHKGYGYLQYEGGHMRAHRLVLISKGHDMRGMHAMHKCDNPPCCNPKHLTPGTPKDNVHDCHAKGRAAIRFGEASPVAKLTTDDVLNARAKHAALAPAITKSALIKAMRTLAREYGVSYRGLMFAVNRVTWRHVP